jgi:hypothetical protein
LIYTPTANFSGVDHLTFRANNGQVDSNVATITITVQPVNDAPVVDDQTLVTNEDTPLTITLSATDLDSQTLAYSLVTTPTNGALTGSPPTLTYTPTVNFSGVDHFTFKANDGLADSNVATVTVTVQPVNDAPVAADQAVTAAFGSTVVITLTATDPDGDPLTFRLLEQPQNGALDGAGPIWTYAPDLGFSGSDQVAFVANDGQVDSNRAVVAIQVATRPTSLDESSQPLRPHRFYLPMLNQSNPFQR